MLFFFFFFQAEDGIRDAQESRGLGDVYKRQVEFEVASCEVAEDVERGVIISEFDMVKVVHPTYPFEAVESADVLKRYFGALGTTIVKGVEVVDADGVNILLDGLGLGMKVAKSVSLSDFKSLLTVQCTSEAVFVGKMRALLKSMEERLFGESSKADASILTQGFWAHKCVLPCVSEVWQRVWVVVDDTKVVWSLENSSKPQGAVPIGNLADAHLSCMLNSKCPRKFARNGLSLQLNKAANPLQLVLCGETVDSVHQLLKHIRKRRIAIAREAVGNMDDEDDDDSLPVWSCRSGFKEWSRCQWSVRGDSIVHWDERSPHTLKKWPIRNITSVSSSACTVASPPTKFKSYSFILQFSGGTLFCCAENYNSKEQLLSEIRKGLIRAQLTSPQRRTGRQEGTVPGASPMQTPKKTTPIRKTIM
eukprot:TRINITY_DN6156_c0_g1_i4.p1 TRINITY_DN6156_c0_g1~~TRINITY_DN6156_c0_g1_i4.p1  ORF type:complete len:420 (+),score=53.42 TRINITY_DN6156_c0_g1_i4:42-1301(+)